MSESVDKLAIKAPTINLAIGPSCPVRCEGCYNYFGDTAIKGGLISSAEILDFTESTRGLGIKQTTLSGGDPLNHPEIIDIAVGLRELNMTVKMDTVGSSLIGARNMLYKGTGVGPAVDIKALKGKVHQINLPLDGADSETVLEFRKGRPRLFEETLDVAALLRVNEITFGFNTVLHHKNIGQLALMQAVVRQSGAAEWQIFEYDPTGPNPSRQKLELALPQNAFKCATDEIPVSSITQTYKSLTDRNDAYFIIDDSGLAWKPGHEQGRIIIGNITSERKKVLQALSQHLIDNQLQD